MKKWIFPLILFVIELIFSILFLTPSIVKSLPQFFIWIKDFFGIVLSWISKVLHLPTFTKNGATNNIIANLISLSIIDILIITLYFIIYFLVKKKKKKQLPESDKEVLPKNEFDSILFEKRAPVLRLVFMWLPLNLWILYFFVLNSPDLQDNFAKSSPHLYKIFAQNIEFYNQNAAPLFERDDAVKIAILFIGLIIVGFIYWMIFSIFAALLKNPLARFRARKAMHDHEKRVSVCQSEEATIENLDIIEHAKFIHSKSIVETIATVDIKKLNEQDINKSNYFDDVAEGIVDLGIEERKQLEIVAKPNLERKPLRIIYPSIDKARDMVIDDTLESKENSNLGTTNESKKIAKNIILSPKFDVLNEYGENNKSTPVQENNVFEEKTEDANTIKPLNPTKFRKPVKVVPVKPKDILLKNFVDETEVVDVGDDNG